jgi:hypothetical protein
VNAYQTGRRYSAGIRGFCRFVILSHTLLYLTFRLGHFLLAIAILSRKANQQHIQTSSDVPQQIVALIYNDLLGIGDCGLHLGQKHQSSASFRRMTNELHQFDSKRTQNYV